MSNYIDNIPSSTILSGLQSLWNNKFYVFGYTLSTTQSNGVDFNSLNNDFSKNIAYYFDVEDLLFLLYQSTDSYVQITDSISTIVFNQNNIIQILKYKWNKSITQLDSLIVDIIKQNDYIIYKFQTNKTNLFSNNESEIFKINSILQKFNERYTIHDSVSVLYPYFEFKYKINWDNILCRFYYKTEQYTNHNIYIDEIKHAIVGNTYSIYTYIDGLLDYNVSYSSSNINIATISSNGLLTAISPGQITLTITSLEYSISKEFTINIYNSLFRISDSVVYLSPGQSKKIISFFNDDITSNVISSIDNNISTIQNNVIKAGQNQGTSLLQITNEDGQIRNCRIVVVDKILVLEESNIDIQIGSTKSIQAYYANKETNNVTYNSSDINIATVDSNGIITPIATDKSSCYITITSLYDNSTIQLVVNIKKPSIFVNNCTLQNTLGSSLLTTSSLKLSGYIGEGDILALQNMSTNGILSYLDLEDVQFVYNNYMKSSFGLTSKNCIPNDFLKNCTKLQTIILPKDLLEIGTSSFNGCTSLSSVVFNDKLQKINTGAFQKTIIPSINLPGSLNYIGNSIFENCSVTTLINILDGDSTQLSVQYRAFSYMTNLTKLVLPSRTSYISNGILDYSNNCKDITIKAITPPQIGGVLGGIITSPIKVPSQSTTLYKATPIWSTYNYTAIL